MRWTITIGVPALLLLGIVGILGWYALRPAPAPAPVPPPAPPATQALTTAPAATGPSSQLAPRPIVEDYLQLLKSLPGMGEAAISEQPLPMDHLARLHLPYPAYVCPRGDLWITHPLAPPLPATGDSSDGVHLVKKEVVFVHWVTQDGKLLPLLIYREGPRSFRARLAGAKQEAPLGRSDYRWPAAMSVGEAIAVPTERGISVIRFGSRISEDYRPLSERPDAQVQVALTEKGFLAVSDQAARFTDGQWQPLGEDWKGPFLQVVPFADGSVLQIRPEGAKGGDRVSLRIATLDAQPPDRQKLLAQVQLLSSDEASIRDAAHDQLLAMGPAAWQLLEELLPTLSGEAMVRVEEIVANRQRPTLGRLRLLDDRLTPAWYLPDGIVYLAEAGVSSGPLQEAQTAPAWISVRRGQPIAPLPRGLARSVVPGSSFLYASRSEWIHSDAQAGAQWFFGQSLLPLTEKTDLRYRELAGIDRRSRILLRSVDPEKPGYLLIDPFVADPAPLLQVWQMNLGAVESGWDEQDWPAVRREQAAYVLKREGWEALKTPLIRSGPANPPAAAGDGISERLAVEGATEVWAGAGELELRSNGRSGRQARPAGLPPKDLAGVLHGGKLYLLHPDAKLSRLTVSPDAAAPFAVDAVFVRDAPALGRIVRAWVDPAGRLCVASGEAEMTIIFLEAKIPAAVYDLIPGEELKLARPAE